MGCGYSGEFTKKFQSAQYQEWNRTFTALKISKSEVYKLYKKFQKVDLDHGGTIDIVELLTVIDVERTPFTEQVFSVFDEDKSGKIDFYEFVLSLWNYCTLSKVTLGMFAFDLYDRDSSGILEEKDIYLMLKDIYGKDVNSHYAKQVRKDLETFMEERGDINLERFLQFIQYHHSLLFPAFQMQLALKQNILGVRFWEKCSERRIRLSQKKYITIKEIIEMHALQAKQESLKGELVTTDTGKLAIQSLGIAHDRRVKYSNNSTDPDDFVSKSLDSFDNNTTDNSHGQSYQSLTSLAAHPPAVETIGMISQKTSNKPTRTSVKNVKGSQDMLDAMMNPHISVKSPNSSVRAKDEGNHHPPHHHHHHHHQHHHHHHHESAKSHQVHMSNKEAKIAMNKIVPMHQVEGRAKSPTLPPTKEGKPSAKEDLDIVMASRKSNASNKNGNGGGNRAIIRRSSV